MPTKKSVKYKVTVEGLGTVYEGTSMKAADAAFIEHTKDSFMVSRTGFGRERDVFIMEDGEISNAWVKTPAKPRARR